MSSPPPHNPFLDPDTDQPLPPTPPAPPFPPRSAFRTSTPLPTGLPPIPVLQNPFVDPSHTTPESSTPGKSKPQGWSSNPYHAAVMSGANNKENPASKKPVSTKSEKSGKSSLISGATTLVSRTPPFAPSYPPDHDVNKPSTSIYTVSNPFTDPKPVPQHYKPASSALKNGSTRSLPTWGISVRDFAPSRSATPSVSKTLQHVQNINTRHHLRPPKVFPPRPRTKHDIDKEIKLRATARHQNHLLELERLKTIANLYLETPRLHPSPRTAQRGRNRDISTGSGSGLIQGNNAEDVRTTRPKRSLVSNPWFWIFFSLIQIGLVSTGAAFAVLLIHKELGQGIKIGTGMVFWLTCSVAASVIGIIGSSCIWGSGNRCCAGMLRKAGLEEMGLMPNYGRNESEVARGFKEREEEDRRILDRLARVRARERERMGREGSMSSIRTIDPLWQALYETPEELRNKLQREMRGENRRERPMEMEIRAGLEVRKKRSVGAETMLSGGSELRNFNESDIGAQMLTPTSLPYSTSTVSEFINQHHSRNENTTDSRFPFSKLRANAKPTERQKHYHDRQKANRLIIPGSSHSHKNKDQDNLSSPSSISSLSPPSPYMNNYTNANQQLITNSPSPQPEANLNNGTTTLQTFSPLENLARELNTPELRKLSAEDRHGYFVSRRSETEEGGRKVRQSLERVGNTASIGLERKPTITRRKLKPIVQERVRGFENRSLSERTGGGREMDVLTRDGVLKGSSLAGSEKSSSGDDYGGGGKGLGGIVKGKSLGNLVVGKKTSPSGANKLVPEPEAGVLSVGEKMDA